MKNILVALVLVAFCMPASAQDQSLRQWFNSLKNPQGQLCCHNFDGISLDEADWRSKGGGYEVVVDGKWIDVPPEALVSVPNRLGRAHLWLKPDGTPRCFIAGTLI